MTHTLPSCPDYSTAIENHLISVPHLIGGTPEMHNGRLVKYAGGYCIVFPYLVGEKKYAVRCWHAYLEKAKERTKIIAGALLQAKLPYFVEFEYVDNGISTSQGVQPVVVMDWVEAKPIKTYIEENLYNSKLLGQLAATFYKMTQDLHSHCFSHGDLQHGNILVRADGSIVLVDYDSMYVPELSNWSDEISGLPGYQHPARRQNKLLSPKADYFSEMVIYTSIMALASSPQLWDEMNISDTDTLLFDSADLNSKGYSPIFNKVEQLTGCVELVQQIRNALSCADINEIEPLCVVSLADKLSDKWKNNGYVAPLAYQKSDVDGIAGKW